LVSARDGGFVSLGATALQPLPAEGDAVDAAIAVLESEGVTAEDTALWGFGQSADFADRLERLSRRVEHLQVIAAGAVDRSRTAALTAAAAPLVPNTIPTGTDRDADPNADGSRNTVEFLRTRLGISACEARRRLTLAESILPRPGFGGQHLPPRYEELATAAATGLVGSRAATTITLALDRARHFTTPARTAQMEHDLTTTAIDNDADFLTQVARHWTEAIDQDGTEPSEPALRHLQGAFIRRPKHGLHHLEIFATPEQFETLTTAMNTATNPRTKPPNSSATEETNSAATAGAATGSKDAGSEGTGGAGAGGAADSDAVLARWDSPGVPEVDLDHRSQGQKRLDGLIGAVQTALTTDALPANGGHRPQILVTIDYRDLYATVQQWQNQNLPETGTPATTAQTTTARTNTAHTGTGTALFAFSGPVNPATIRKIACDADILPVVLGSQGRILDIGRTSRIFPPHIRKAITARDQGCAFPECTMPAPWCEAHHITYWSQGGPTSTSNGVLLCSHHHHLIHKEHWTIEITNEVPWFKPPPELDPQRKPRRNHYFTSRPHHE
jgi:hypothetical protein